MSEAKDEIRLSALLCATKREQGGYAVTYRNGVDMGALEMDVDGYYKYWPEQRAGYWDAPPMRAIADLLDHVNAEWDAQVRKDCGA
ncbi:MAG: hypothetical protein H7842_15395 [Gammaproteobacteria bacterium SHHR-1]